MEIDVEYLQMGNLLDPNRTPVMKTSHYSLLRPRLSDPFLNENQRDGKKNGRLVGKSLPLRSLHSICFAFCLLAAWEHCLGKKVATERFAGTALAVQSDAGQKS